MILVSIRSINTILSIQNQLKAQNLACMALLSVGIYNWIVGAFAHIFGDIVS